MDMIETLKGRGIITGNRMSSDGKYHVVIRTDAYDEVIAEIFMHMFFGEYVQFEISVTGCDVHDDYNTWYGTVNNIEYV